MCLVFCVVVYVFLNFVGVDSWDYFKANASCRRPPKYERYKRNKHIKIEQMGNGHIRTYAVLEGFNQNGYLHHNRGIAVCEAQVPGIVFGCIAESVSKAEKQAEFQLAFFKKYDFT